MSERELRRGEALSRVKRGELKLKQGAERLELSYRQAKRLYHKYKQAGATARETIEGVEPQTQFGRMCEKLGIRVIGASSPQAKGRAERHPGTGQDRLVKKMRWAGIADYEAATRLLEGYQREHNERFARRPAAAADCHLKLGKRQDLRRAFCLEQERVVSRDFVVRYQNRWLQLKVRRNQPVWAGTRVRVEQWRDGSLHVAHEGRESGLEEIARPEPKPKPAPAAKRPVASIKPKADHPWKRFPAVAKQAANP